MLGVALRLGCAGYERVVVVGIVWRGGVERLRPGGCSGVCVCWGGLLERRWGWSFLWGRRLGGSSRFSWSGGVGVVGGGGVGGGSSGG